MNKSDYNLRGCPWMILTVLFVWLLPQRAAATAYLEDADNYTVMLGGSNIVRFSAPVYDKKGLDQWITDGNLKVTVDGTTNTVFHWEVAETDISDNQRETITHHQWYTLDGRLLNGKPTAKGVYIVNGKAVVIK